MPVKYIRRSLEPVLQKSVHESPAVIVTGPRQAGKTTLIKALFGKTHKYVSLDPPDISAAAESDPRGFLELNPSPVIFDEIQSAPGLLPYIKEKIDKQRDRSGQYILTGSQNLMMIKTVTESLAGRALILKLLPLSNREVNENADLVLPWETGYRSGVSKELSLSLLWKRLLIGFYPEPVANPKKDLGLWLSSYIQTYLERDVRSLRQIGDLTTFQSFLRVLAARSGQVLNLADVSRDLGVAFNTAKQWLSILEATFQIVILRPYHSNIGKRLIKTPKVYFTDTGILCHLVQLKEPEHVAAGPLNGPVFETAVLMEIMKTLINRGEDPRLYFWRTSHGVEVDIIVESRGRLIPIEVKASSTPRPAMASGLTTFLDSYADNADQGFLVHTGDIRLPLAPNIKAIPFAGF